MTLAHHQQMAPYAANMVDATRRHIKARSDYDEDYIGHYASKAHRNGHTQKTMQEELSEEKLWRRDDDHRRAVHGEDKAAQKEARTERIREKEERRRRMGYERSKKDSVSTSPLGILSIFTSTNHFAM